jgi:hypothetical protein
VSAFILLGTSLGRKYDVFVDNFAVIAKQEARFSFLLQPKTEQLDINAIAY